mgnify:CR=1 FL=1
MNNEARLIKKAKAGNLEAFEQLILQYEKRIYNFCYRMTNNQEDAEDLAQEIFIKVYKNLNSFKGNSKFSTWIYRIAYNTCVDKYRKKKVTTVSLTLNNDEEEKEIDLPSNDPLPEERVVSREEYDVVCECISALKPEYKTVVVLRDIQNYTYDEIAEILNVPLGTVKSHISRGRAALRDALIARGVLYNSKGVE